MKVLALCLCVLATALCAPAPQSVVPATGPAEQIYPIIPYSYQYEVQDAPTGNYQNKAEMKTANGDVFGSYSVLMPDGYIYTTTYNVTGPSGYVANLVRTLATQPFVGGPEAGAGSAAEGSKAAAPASATPAA